MHDESFPPAPEPGQMVPAEGGIFLGRQQILSKTFNVFAAPEDLPETMKYVDVVKHIASLKDGSYNGNWIIPTRELLVGTEPDGQSGIRKGKAIQPDNLFDHQNKGAFKGTFKTPASSGSDYWYWSSTEHRDDPSCVWVVRFSDGNEGWLQKNILRLRCRPVRLVEVVAFDDAPILLERGSPKTKPLRFKSRG